MRQAARNVLIVVLLQMTSVAFAHVGFDHFVGAITVIDAEKVELKTEKATVVFKLAPSTRYLRRGEAVAHGDFAAGARVVIDARRENDAWVAKEMRFVVEAD